MSLNTYQLDHVSFSQTRTYMALVMGATMAVVMLPSMMGMYKNQGRGIDEMKALIRDLESR